MKEIIILGLFLIACESRKKADESVINKNEDTGQIKTADKSPFSFEFKIMKGGLGPIKIGMTMQEIDDNLKGLTRKEIPVYHFGFDGETLVPSYYLRDTLVLALIKTYNTDSVRFIIAAHKNLHTSNGLSANSSVKDLLEKYPDITVSQSLMSPFEHMSDHENGWDFSFLTDSKGFIGEYQIAGEPTKPKNLAIVSNWIMIR